MNIVRLLNYSVEGNKYCVFSVMPLYAINFCYFFFFRVVRDFNKARGNIFLVTL